jgi:hypothetical protein
MTFTLTIDLGNDAMQAPEDVAAALRRVAREVDCWAEWPIDDGEPATIADNMNTTVRDANGNTVGEWAVSR